MKDAPGIVVHAHEDYKKLLDVLKLGRMAGALLGQQLYRLNANRAWQQATGDECSWEEFLKMPEINLDKREATRAMEIYEEFCIKREYSVEMLAEAGTKNLHYLLPMVKQNKIQKKDIDGLLKSGATLTQAGFKERLQDVKNPGGERHYEFVLMRRCIETNNLQKVHEVESDDIVKAFQMYGNDISNLIFPEIV